MYILDINCRYFFLQVLTLGIMVPCCTSISTALFKSLWYSEHYLRSHAWLCCFISIIFRALGKSLWLFLWHMCRIWQLMTISSTASLAVRTAIAHDHCSSLLSPMLLHTHINYETSSQGDLLKTKTGLSDYSAQNTPIILTSIWNYRVWCSLYFQTCLSVLIPFQSHWFPCCTFQIG